MENPSWRIHRGELRDQSGSLIILRNQCFYFRDQTTNQIMVKYGRMVSVLLLSDSLFSLLFFLPLFVTRYFPGAPPYMDK